MNPAHLQLSIDAHGLVKAGKADEALALLQKGARRGSSALLDNAMAIVLTELGRLDEAEFFAVRATQGAPGSSDIWSTLGNVLFIQDKTEQAASAFDKALKIRPDNQRARLNLANLQRLRDRPTEAGMLLEALGSAGQTPEALATLIGAKNALALPEEAWEISTRASGLFPNSLELAGQRANLSNAVPGLTPEEIRAAHLAFGAMLDRVRPRRAWTFANSREPERTLRVGFLSADLRRHSVAYFLEPLLEGLKRGAGENRLEVWCYALHAKDDEVSRRLRGLSHQWRSVAWQSDEQILNRIREDRIDVLVDLAGHTERARQGVLHQRATPVQVGYLGYPNITGISSMDARLVDGVSDPVGGESGGPRSGHSGPERLLRMDAPFLCYRAPDDAPAPALAPREADAGARFGSFNATTKLNRQVVSAWAEILRRVPGSTLLLKAKAFDDPALRAEFPTRLAALGVAPERIVISPQSKTTPEHLAMYAQVDVALDTFPYHGTTTTCEALWQGVPVVTVAGNTHASRVGASLLGAVGLDGLVASDVDGYVRLACELAADRGRITALRGTLRGRMAGSRLCDQAAIAGSFAGAVRGLWRGWCETGR